MIVIFNPTAGRRKASLLWRVLDVLSANGVSFEVAATRHAGHATELAREAARGGKLVVAAGGDGTIAEVANGLIGSEARLGIVPLGTANVLAHELRLPAAPGALAAALAFGRTRLLWPGLARGPQGDRLFVQMLGAGLDAQVVHRMPPPLKRCLGRGGYALQTLHEIARCRLPPLSVRIDGVVHAAAGVIVSKGRLYAGPYLLAPGARCDAPGFWVTVLAQGGRLPALACAAALPLNLMPRLPGVRTLAASQVEISSTGCVPVQTDGDMAGTTPLRVADAAAPIAVVTA